MRSNCLGCHANEGVNPYGSLLDLQEFINSKTDILGDLAEQDR